VTYSRSSKSFLSVLALWALFALTLTIGASGCGNPCDGMSQAEGELCAENYNE